MGERIVRLRTHHRNIDRYQNLLKTRLNETELQFVEKRISEERFAVAKLSNDLPVHGVGRAGP